VLTGAASGIGNAIFKQLSLYDTNLVCADMIKEDLWKNKIKTTNHKFFSFQCDLSKPEEIDKLFNFALEKMGGIDLFIANAGIPYYEKISQPDWKHISKIYETKKYPYLDMPSIHLQKQQ
jgi:short-subunit dehydrogenase